jgi:hypothetical protein
VRQVKSFAAAGIANRVLALFDNDAAAGDALRTLDVAGLPSNIRVMQFPYLLLAANYPTLGPPVIGAPEGSISQADVNGLAASVQLYLGRDVLIQANGDVRPVHWRSYIPGIQRYQGEVTGKDEIHRAFRAKCSAALTDPTSVANQDWEGLRLILDNALSSIDMPNH